MQHTTKYGKLTTLIVSMVVIIMVLTAFCFPLPAIADHEIPQTPCPTITPTPNYSQADIIAEQFRISILSLAAFLSALTLVIVTIGKVFKPVRMWFIGWMRKSLQIVDSNKTIDDRFEDAEKQVASESQTRQNDYNAMAIQNKSIELTLSEVLKSVEEINRKFGTLETSNLALLGDSITKTYYKYCKRQAIPIHEKEAVSRAYDIYLELHGNSYICGLMKQIEGWGVLYGDDAPSCKVKLD